MRAISILEGHDNRAGLNLTSRTLAGILKYDSKIPELRKQRKNKDEISKGYYFCEADIVQKIKNDVGFNKKKSPFPTFKTIECSIMDIADDIAYSIYDLDDSFKAGFLDPVSMLANYDHIIPDVSKTTGDRLRKFYPDLEENDLQFSDGDVFALITEPF